MSFGYFGDIIHGEKNGYSRYFALVLCSSCIQHMTYVYGIGIYATSSVVN
jgi:hypothetical protein